MSQARARSTSVALLTFCILSMLGCAQDQRVREHAQEAIAAGRYEEGLAEFRQERAERPDSITLKVGELSARVQLIAELLERASEAELAGHLDQANAVLQRALALEPANARIQERMARLAVSATQQARLEQAQAMADQRQSTRALQVVEQALKDSPGHPGLLSLRRKLLAAQRDREVEIAQTSLAEKRLISLDFRDANLRTVLEVVSRNSGLNFVFDPGVKMDARVTVYLKNTKLEDALDLLVSTHQLAKKVLDSKTVLIYPNTPEKNKEYQEQIVRVFYLANADAKAASNFLKSMLHVKDPFVDEKANLLSMRDSQENIALAEKLLAVFDASEPEVLLDVEVMEVTSNRLMQLGVSLPTSFSLTPIPSDTSTASGIGAPSTGTTTKAGTITLRDLLHRLDGSHISVGIGGVNVDAKSTTGDVTTLANPKLRARNKEKATVMIGDKIPVVTSTVGTGGFVSENVTYQDVGLKLNVEPVIYPNDEVAIKMGLEVSTLGAAVTTSAGSTAYQISTRNATTVLRLKDGETQMLAGLLSRNKGSSKTGLPFLSELPLLGRLFSDQQDINNQTELVLAVTPHILRNVRPPLAHEAETWVGTETMPRIRPYGGLNGTNGSAEAHSTTEERLPLAEKIEPRVQDALETKPKGGLGQTPSSAVQTAGVRIELKGPAQVKVGETFEVGVALNASVPLRGLPLELIYDTVHLALVDAKEGPFFRLGDAATNFSYSNDAAAGRLTLGVIRQQATAVPGQGLVSVIRFKAISPGASAIIRMSRATPLSLGAPIDGAPLPAPIELSVKAQ